MMDKSWMRQRNRLCKEYVDGVKLFMEAAKRCQDENGCVRCPCKECQNAFLKPLNMVQAHLFQFGIAVSYEKWIFHGEKDDFVDIGERNVGGMHMHHEDETNIEEQGSDELYDLIRDMHDATSVEKGLIDGEENIETFTALLGEAGRKLYPGCKFSTLNFVVKLMHMKVLNQWSNKSMDMLLKTLKSTFPEGTNLPESTYDAKKMLKDLGLGYEIIHACKYDCVLFWKEHELCDRCPYCNEPRYKFNRGKKKVPQKVLRYFPLKNRLQQLFMSRHTARDMRWHQERRVAIEGVLKHPADGQAWKEFDQFYPSFSQDPRNVRMGLASDGFNPFGNKHNSYSMWPVILVPYNLPPWKCMKDPFMMMSLLIPGPHAPGKDIDVYLRPLIEELKELWEHGVKTYDATSGQYFQMRAAVLWTINDFPAYGILSGWSTKGYKACPVCNEETSSQPLRSKICYMGHRRYLSANHLWRRSDQHDGNLEMRSAPKEYSGEEILKQLEQVKDAIPGKSPQNKDRKRKRDANELNWTKRSIFFELEYWSKLKIRHNLDVMHIEKNICDSVVGTLLNIEGKSKDTLKARLDLEDLNIRSELHLQKQRNGFLKPPATYTLTLKERKEFCRFLKSVKFPDGFASNISKCVNDMDGKLFGLKSHDSHILLQRLIPIGIRKYLRKDVCTAIVELCNFFHQLCAKTLHINDLEKLEKDIVIILCKLERIFPPAFFDIMVHLAVHLPKEAKYGGPVGFRWMYPVERGLGRYKTYAKNKARPEGSIAEAYIVNESMTFCSMYLHSIETRFNRTHRNDDGGSRGESLSVFSQQAQPFGAVQRVEFSKQEIDIAHWYILNNCQEVQPFLDKHREVLERECNKNVELRQQRLFPEWFKRHMRQLREKGSTEVTDELYSLSCGPDFKVCCYPGCIVNGVRFLVSSRDDQRTTQNSGVMVPGEHDNNEFNFYGVLISVVELVYLFGYRVMLFKCKWFDTNPKKKRIQSDYHLTSINVAHTWYEEDPFILATQAKQVFFLDDYKFGSNWKVVEEVQHRGLWDIQEKEVIDVEDKEAFYQEDESSNTVLMVEHEDLNSKLFCRDDVNADVIEDQSLHEEVMATTQNIDDFICDDDEDETIANYFSDDENEWESDDDTDIE